MVPLDIFCVYWVDIILIKADFVGSLGSVYNIGNPVRNYAIMAILFDTMIMCPSSSVDRAAAF